ncbi:cyclin-J isoform X2 [Scleropages formosus]|uniref:cyclin-J isoform X2 n=1 Tax=Scleropages formosus TaxID=113540 RepID=UPI0010FACE6D|nr:cyclin-J isoform X2 [Scleropages formosus]
MDGRNFTRCLLKGHMKGLLYPRCVSNGAGEPVVERTARRRHLPRSSIQRTEAASLQRAVPAAQLQALLRRPHSHCKFEEREDRVPKLETLNCLGCMTSMNLVLTKQSLLHMELLLLETFQWNLYLPTAAHFIEYYLSIAVHETDLHDGWPVSNVEKIGQYMAKYADYFLEVSLQDHEFLNFAPSLVAAACVAASRVVLRLSPAWPCRLQHLTAYHWEHLTACVERLLIAHDEDVKEANKQKCQQQQKQQVAPTVFHGSGAVSTVPQYLHRPALQFPQQNCLSLQPSSHGATSYMSHASIHAGAQPHGHLQPMPASLDTKVNIAFNRAYQVNGHYTSAAPCFDR